MSQNGKAKPSLSKRLRALIQCVLNGQQMSMKPLSLLSVNGRLKALCDSFLPGAYALLVTLMSRAKQASDLRGDTEDYE
jgi:hypothetical protein